jgi:hypothetical protein
MNPKPYGSFLSALSIMLSALPVALAHADERAARVPLTSTYQQECAACHLAYPPGMLPAASWQRLMGNLPRHFGTDASVDAGTRRELSAWLEANAGTAKRVSEAPPEDRLTRSTWFDRKHREVPAAAWKRASIGSASNCAACHRGATQGDFDEHAVRIPK